MKQTVSHAQALASRGFWVFPVTPNAKTPAVTDWQGKATTDPHEIESLWGRFDYNIGIFTGKYGNEGKALLVVDVDVKGGKDGEGTILELELGGYELPITLEHTTPSGGRHLFYVVDAPVKQGVDVLGSGVDIRSGGGYVLGPGSTLEGKAYSQINGHGKMVEAPSWLPIRCGSTTRDHGDTRAPLPGVDPIRAEKRALAYLLHYAKPAIEGTGGDEHTYKVACVVKDYGCTEEQAFFLMWENWNDRCEPPWSADELGTKIHNAYKHGTGAPGATAPEAVFPPIPEAENPPAPTPEAAGDGDDPIALARAKSFEILRGHYSYIKEGAFILEERTDSRGQKVASHWSLMEFHQWFKPDQIQVGKGSRSISELWMENPSRPQFEGVVFRPCQSVEARWFNLWQGFRIAPFEGVPDHPALTMFLEHAFKNVCQSDQKQFDYLMGYFAHLFQMPWVKPLVAIVLQGGKGVGKNALIERIGWLLGPHFLMADDDRYLLGNFNSHIECNLLFGLDEASWAGDKKAEGRLKGLITGQEHNIERKGKEPYRVDNLCRLVIIGNEEWLVPATEFERRYAVFAVGQGRQKDRKFFKDMREGMEQGGYAHLLKYFLTYDIYAFDVNDAPENAALTGQKLATLTPLGQWYYDSLLAGVISHGDWGSDWPEEIPTNRFRDCYSRWASKKNIRGRLESDTAFGILLAKMAPSMKKKRKSKHHPDDNSSVYVSPGIDVLRADFTNYIGGEIQWPTD